VHRRAGFQNLLSVFQVKSCVYLSRVLGSDRKEIVLGMTESVTCRHLCLGCSTRKFFEIGCTSSCCTRTTFSRVFVSGDRNRHPGHGAEPAATVRAAIRLPAAARQTLCHHSPQAAQAGPHQRLPGTAENREDQERIGGGILTEKGYSDIMKLRIAFLKKKVSQTV